MFVVEGLIVYKPRGPYFMLSRDDSWKIQGFGTGFKIGQKWLNVTDITAARSDKSEFKTTIKCEPMTLIRDKLSLVKVMASRRIPYRLC